MRHFPSTRQKASQLELNCSVWLGVFLLHRGHAVVQLVEAVRYKLEGRGLDSRWFNWNFSLT